MEITAAADEAVPVLIVGGGGTGLTASTRILVTSPVPVAAGVAS